MSRSRHHGCGGTCGMCRPWKRWRGNSKRNKTTRQLRRDEADKQQEFPNDQ